MENKENKEVKKITLGLVLAWVLGIFFALGGFGMLFSSFFSGVLVLLIAAILLPPANKFIEKKLNFSLSKGLKIVLILVLLVLAGLVHSGGEPADLDSAIDEVNENMDDLKDAVGDDVEVEEEEEVEEIVEEQEWEKITSLTANARKQSDTFELEGGKQKVEYTLSGAGPVMCSIYVEKEGVDIMVDGGIPVVMITEAMSDETMMRKGEGSYYIDMTAANGSCTVDIYEYR